MAFLESPIMPIGVAYGIEFSIDFDIEIAADSSGHEYRNIGRGGVGLVQGQLRYNVLAPAEHAALLDFVRALKGQGHGFRCRNWSDYQVTTSNGVLVPVLGVPGVYQLTKRHTAGVLYDDHAIYKPSGTPSVYRNAVLQASPANYTLDATRGRVTFVADSTKTITGITKANPGVITIVGHGFASGSLIGITDVVGMTQINGQSGSATVVDADHISIGVDTTNYSTYVSGGSASKYGMAADVLTWSGEFDIPCRFSGNPRSRVVSRSGTQLMIEWEDAGVIELLEGDL